MSFKIGVASGKGGTGKTTVSVNLYHAFCNYLNANTQIIDCDVEEPNARIFFQGARETDYKKIHQLVPEINTNKCTFCKKCETYCEYNAITIMQTQKYASIDESLCHSCGACSVACEFDALHEKEAKIGEVKYFNLNIGNGLVEGRLKIGSTMQTMLIGETKRSIKADNRIEIFDAPPGTSCSVVETLADTNYVILVSEPTPFGLYDLKLMVELLKDIKKPFGLIINKSGIGNNDIYNYCKEEHIEILGELPFSKEYASSYAYGNILNEIPENVSKIFYELSQDFKERFRL